MVLFVFPYPGYCDCKRVMHLYHGQTAISCIAEWLRHSMFCSTHHISDEGVSDYSPPVHHCCRQS